METLVDLVSWAVIAAGGFFYLVGGIGMARMPDLFTRMHAVSVSETLGTGLLMLGMVLQAGFTLVTVKLVIIFLVLMIVAPVSSHALARAALHDGLKPLLVNAKGWLVKTDCVEIFPELGVRLRQPLSSEQVEGDAPVPAQPPAGQSGSQSEEAGYAYALEGDVPVASEGKEHGNSDGNGTGQR